MLLYAATGVMPYIACNYVARFILLGVTMNKNFMQYPIVKPLDLIFARVALEIVSNVFVTFIVVCGIAALGVDVVPSDLLQAALAWAAAVFLGVSLGVFNGVICIAFPIWNLVFVLFIIVAWITCGVFIDPELLPQSYGYYFSFNPVLHAVEWMRLAYYPGFHAHLLSKTFLVYLSAVFIAAGLFIERVGRAFLTHTR